MYQNFNKVIRSFSKLSKYFVPKVPIPEVGKKLWLRKYSSLVPPTQYDVPIPPRLHIGHVLKVYWETIPLFVTTAFAMALLVSAIINSARNKVDVVFSCRSRDSISRTMDLRNPTVHKAIIINQRYEPWPEMQDLLDKMNTAEKRALARAQSCSNL